MAGDLRGVGAGVEGGRRPRPRPRPPPRPAVRGPVPGASSCRSPRPARAAGRRHGPPPSPPPAALRVRQIRRLRRRTEHEQAVHARRPPGGRPAVTSEGTSTSRSGVRGVQTGGTTPVSGAGKVIRAPWDLSGRAAVRRGYRGRRLQGFSARRARRTAWATRSRVDRPSSTGWWQRNRCPGIDAAVNSGIDLRAHLVAFQQRVRNGQPLGGRVADGAEQIRWKQGQSRARWKEWPGDGTERRPGVLPWLVHVVSVRRWNVGCPASGRCGAWLRRAGASVGPIDGSAARSGARSRGSSSTASSGRARRRPPGRS